MVLLIVDDRDVLGLGFAKVPVPVPGVPVSLLVLSRCGLLSPAERSPEGARWPRDEAPALVLCSQLGGRFPLSHTILIYTWYIMIYIYN